MKISFSQADMLITALRNSGIETKLDITRRLDREQYNKILYCISPKYKGSRPKSVIEGILKEANTFTGEDEEKLYEGDYPEGHKLHPHNIKY